MRILGLVFLLTFCMFALSRVIPEKAKSYIPVLKAEIEKHWPDRYIKSILAGQIEQETCITLKHAKCWSPTAELKTNREYGFGLGQITVTSRFNNFEEFKKLNKDLVAWKWENRFDATYQIRALVVYDRHLYSKLPESIWDKDPFMLSAYNGGLGGILQDRKLCQATEGCNPNLWFNNVEKTSFKSKIKPMGYGKSFFEINREYVFNILFVRAGKYYDLLD